MYALTSQATVFSVVTQRRSTHPASGCFRPLTWVSRGPATINQLKNSLHHQCQSTVLRTQRLHSIAGRGFVTAVAIPAAGHGKRARWLTNESLRAHSAVAQTDGLASASITTRQLSPVAIPPVAVAVITVGLFLGRARSASADDRDWHPRRHYSRMGESFTPYWMDSIVEEQIRLEMERAAHEEQTRLLEEERRARLKAEREAKRQEKLRKLEEKRQQEEQAKMRQQVVNSIITLPKRALDTVLDYMGLLNLAVLLVLLTFFARFVFGWVKSLFRAGWKPRGRYVYDRSLGGKKVWVPYSEDTPTTAAPALKTAPLKDDDFDMLSKIAAAARSGPSTEPDTPVSSSIPAWFKPPESGAVPSDVRASKQNEANSLLKALEQSKVAGQDYSVKRLVKLRELCQAAGVSVKPSTPGGRDAMYRQGVEAAVALAMDPESAVPLGNSSPLDFVTGLAVDLNLEQGRGASIVKACAASMLRARLVEVVVAIKKSDDMRCITELVRIASLLTNLPVLQRGDAEVDLIASTLRSRATLEELKKLLSIYWQILPDGTALMAEALGFDPDTVIPQLQKQMDSGRQAGMGDAS